MLFLSLLNVGLSSSSPFHPNHSLLLDDFYFKTNTCIWYIECIWSYVLVHICEANKRDDFFHVTAMDGFVLKAIPCKRWNSHKTLCYVSVDFYECSKFFFTWCECFLIGFCSVCLSLGPLSGVFLLWTCTCCNKCIIPIQYVLLTSAQVKECR